VVLSSVVGGLMMLASASVGRADVVADQSGAVLIFPKIIVDTSGVFEAPTDTILQITNTSNSVISAHCFLVDTTPRCIGIDPDQPDHTACNIADEADGEETRCTGSRCLPRWDYVADFQFTLTKRQPIAWKASDGLLSFPCGGPVVDPNNPGGCQFGSNVSSNGAPSSIPPIPDDPFFGELKCVQVSPDDLSAPAVGVNDGNDRGGDLSGHATIVSTGGNVDVRKYNAIALQSTGINDGNGTLLIGGEGAEYNGCPHTLTMQHLFDDAVVEYDGGSSEVESDLTLVSCSQDFSTESTTPATVQLLVFNEFEQRFSASIRVDCWTEVQLSDLVNRPGESDDAFSLWNVNVAGTLTGQTRIRPVASNGKANGFLGIVEEFWERENDNGREFSGAYQLNIAGTSALGDRLILSPDLTGDGD
jgi:hypothetical protein